MADKPARTVYKVVVNHEEQYSIWPADLAPPRGWKDVAPPGALDEAVAHVKSLTKEA